MKQRTAILLITALFLSACTSTTIKANTDKSVLKIVNKTDYPIKRVYLKESMTSSQKITLAGSAITPGGSTAFIVDPGKYIIGAVFNVKGREVAATYEAILVLGQQYKWELIQEEVEIPPADTGPLPVSPDDSSEQ
ncbi:MAG: hypothetical protein JW874_12125 [Spirochaetales bacterium]|nr:hypothetical protein [Spirochaetales bacterium]